MVLRRKHFAILFVLISLIIIFIVTHSQLSSESISTIDSIYISDKDYLRISASPNLTNVPLSTDIYFGDEKLLYDSEANTFYYSLIQDDATAYTPVVEVGEPSIVVVLYGDMISDESIANNSHIKLILMSGNNVSISDLICTSLPIMNITIDQAVVSGMGLDETYDILTDAASSIYVYDNRSDFDGRSRSITSDAKIHRRGQTNSVFPSKSYRITLLEDKNNLDGNKNKENILGLRNDDDWILYSPYKDYEKIRNVFSMNLWYDSFAKDNEWSVTNATEYRYIELFMNNHYHGLYAICYPIDKKQVSLQDGETLFKKLDWTHSERDTSLTIQENGDAILPGYEIKSGDISGYNDLLSLYVNMTYSTDGNVVRLSSDMENAIDLWLYYKVSLAVDNVAAGGAKNMFVSTKNSESGIEGKKLLISPWDMDQSWRWVAEGSSGLYSYPM